MKAPNKKLLEQHRLVVGSELAGKTVEVQSIAAEERNTMAACSTNAVHL